MSDCFKIMKELTGDKLDDDTLKAIIEQLETERDFRRATGKVSEADALVRKAGIDIGEAEIIAKKREQYAKYKNIIVRRDIWNRVIEANDMVDDPSLGLRSVLGGVDTPIEHARYSVDSQGVSMSGELRGGMIYDMRDAGVLTQFNTMKGGFEDEVAEAIFQMNRAKPGPVKASVDAKKIAGIIIKYNETLRHRLNAEGAYIGKRDGFITTRTHDQWIIHRAGKNTWVKAVRNRLNFNKMGIHPGDVEKFLSSTYDAISTGVRLERVAAMTKDEVAKVNDIFASSFKGTRNIAKKVSSARVLEFNTAADDMWYNRTYGGGSLRESVMASLDGRSTTVAAMKIMGPNPEAMYQSIKTRMERTYRDSPAKMARINGGIANLDHMMKEITGEVNMVKTNKQARVADVSAGITLVQSMAKLGGVIFSVLPDMSLMSSSRMFHGRGLIGSWHDVMLAPIEGLAGGQRRKVAEQLRVGTDGMIGALMARYNATDHFTGRMAKTSQTFFKLNLLTPWTDMMQRGNTLILARDLGDFGGVRFDDLPIPKQRLLKIYGLTGKKWEVARLAIKKADDGGTYLLPGDVEDVTGAVFNGMNKSQQGKLKADVRDRVYTLLKSEAEMGVIEPGLRERAIIRRGTSKGSATGIALRQMMLFKSFGVTVLSKGFGRQIYGTGAKSAGDMFSRGLGANLGLINLMVAGTMLGYVSLQLKEIRKGREPRPWSVKTFFASMAQGGGAGIYGDFLFAEYNRYGGGTLGTIAGPTIGTAAELIDTLNKARAVLTGDETSVSGDLVRLIKYNVPFANLLVAKEATDYLFWYQLQEAMNPGYLRRNERRVKKQNATEYWLPPSKIVKRGGGFQ